MIRIPAAAPDREFHEVQCALAGQYSLERELGRGGMGIVYLAREVELERLVAIKVLPPALSARSGLRERFLREARTAARLSHPNIVPIHRVGEAGDLVYFTMAYVDGETLGDRLRGRGKLSPEEATRVLRETAWALAYAHAQGVVHRDVKPDNILIERDGGRILVSDFGIAHVQDGADDVVTRSEDVTGTAHYMSPEQASASPVDGRSDLYSLGVVGYVALSGQLPFEGESREDVLARHLSEMPEPLRNRAPHVSAALASAVERCLAKSPDGRFASGEALADALTPGLERQPGLPLPLRAWAQARDPMRAAYLAFSGVSGLAVLTFASLERVTPGLWVGMPLIPLVPITLFELRQAARILKQGYALADIRLAINDATARRREEIAAELDAVPSLLVMLLRGFGWGCVSLFGGSVVLANVLDPATLEMLVRPLAALLDGMTVKTTVWIASVVVLGGPAALVLASSLGAPPLGRSLRIRAAGRFRQWWWNSRMGEWAARLVHRGSTGSPSALVARPTEMALGLAAADIFASLPSTLRADLEGLPHIICRLEQRAGEARGRLEELQALHREAEGEAAAAFAARGAEYDDTLMSRRAETVRELGTARDLAREELSRAVAALERIRLDLLRLAAGNLLPSDVTTFIGEAERAVEDLSRLVEARQEVERLTGERSLPGSTGSLLDAGA
jgi:serine/threonine protein kinase